MQAFKSTKQTQIQIIITDDDAFAGDNHKATIIIMSEMKVFVNSYECVEKSIKTRLLF